LDAVIPANTALKPDICDLFIGVDNDLGDLPRLDSQTLPGREFTGRRGSIRSKLFVFLPEGRKIRWNVPRTRAVMRRRRAEFVLLHWAFRMLETTVIAPVKELSGNQLNASQTHHPPPALPIGQA